MIRRLKNTGKFSLVFIFLLSVTLFSLSSCKNNSSISSSVIVESFTTYPEEMKGLAKDKKIYLTSIGQSLEIDNFMYDADQLDIFEYTYDNELSASSVENGSVVFAFVGCSIKGLGESGITLEEEISRARSLVNACKNGRFSLVAFHLGGVYRRGTTSDRLINIVFASSTFNIYVGSGNSDGLLSTVSISNNIPCYEISNSYTIEETLNFLFGIEDNE